METTLNLRDAYSFQDSFSSKLYFVMKTNTMPATHTFRDIDYKTLLKKLRKNFEITDVNCVLEYGREEKEDKVDGAFIEIENNLMLRFTDYEERELGHQGLLLLYNQYTDKEKLELVKKIIAGSVEKDNADGKIWLLQHGRIFYLSSFEMPDFKVDLKSNYNDDLMETDKAIIERLNKKNDKGILFLHGKPGTGKTWYIRSLIKRVKKRMIFIPPDVAGLIGKPEFMSFLAEYSNSVIIIEDAENLVVESPERKSVVSNILNLSDGLLSDCFHMQVICTFNTDIQRIDQALLRKGRVIARYEFKALEKSKAQVLLTKNGSSKTAESDMTLADIYNEGEKSYSENGQERKLGFR